MGQLIPTEPPAPVPALSFANEADELLSLSSYSGRPVLLNLWATWCAPCIEELPTLVNLQMQIPDLQVLPVAFDLGGAPAVRRFYDEHEIKGLPVLIEKQRSLRKAYKPKGLPFTLVIDANGNEVGRVVGKLAWDTPETVGALKILLDI